MARLIIIMRDGTKLQLDGQPGRSVMENIRKDGTGELLALAMPLGEDGNHPISTQAFVRLAPGSSRNAVRRSKTNRFG
jgi:hypothetical protein